MINRKQIVRELLSTYPMKRLLEFGEKTEFASPPPASGQYDVIFLEEYHSYEGAYSAIEQAIGLLAEDGVIVIHNCKPTNEVIGLPSNSYAVIDPEVRAANHKAWTGDVWKAIVRLRSTRSDVSVVTLDCDWGCALITLEKASNVLCFSLDEVDAMTFADLAGNELDLLNTKSADYFYTYLLHHRYGLRGERTSLYVEDVAGFTKGCIQDYELAESPQTQIIENGVILPVKKLTERGAFSGGVCNEEGTFVAGHQRNQMREDIYGNISYSYPFSDDIPFMDETVVYGGFVYGAYGHMILECLSRMWWFLEHRNCGYKFVFISLDNKMYYLDFFLMLGLSQEDIIVLDEPTRFRSIIIPNQLTFTTGSGYRQKAMTVFDAIRDSVEPSPHKKVYLTRLQFTPRDTVGEEYFVDHYRGLGYEIIAPERLSITEQVSLMAGAEEVVCLSGTLHHQILFCHNGINVTVLNKTEIPLMPEFWINQARSANCTFIDISENFLPCRNFRLGFLLAPTVHWKRYIRDHYPHLSAQDIDIHSYVGDYVEIWAGLFARQALVDLKAFSRYTLADLVINIQKYLLQRELNAATQTKLRDAFTRVE